MKKIIMLAVVLTTITVTAFAGNNSGISDKILSSFSKSFQSVEDVRWELKGNLYKASFKSDGKTMFAYYNANGDRIALTRNIHIEQLPLALSSELKSKFDSCWLTELFEISSDGGTAYYATLECATHITILKSEGTSGWSIFKKEKRK